jgi:hypothetical protein
MCQFTEPQEIDFGNGSFKIVVEPAQPLDYLPEFTEYPVHYIAHDSGISADIVSEAWNSDFYALITAFTAILDEFEPGTSWNVNLSHGVFSLVITTSSRGPLDLLISLHPDLTLQTVFTFEMRIEQEQAKRIVQELNALFNH